MLQNRNGFTLIELMIVVAIIGILAAVAVPGFMKYIKDSKTTEAKVNIKAIAEGASSFYQSEHNKQDGSVYTRQYPSETFCKTIAGAATGCVATSNLPDAIPVAGTKNNNDWAAEPWLSLNFTSTAPVYYTYSYSGIAGSNSAGSSFNSQAAAKLDKTTVDSCFTLDGTTDTNGDPKLTAIVDKSEAETACTTF